MPARASSAPQASLSILLDELAVSCRRVRRILALSALAFTVGAVAFLGTGLASGGWRLLPVLSGSMEPAFGPGDAVLVERARLTDVRVGDVIAYRVPVGDRPLTTHRVVAVLEPGERPLVRTKGDANVVVDPWDARLSGRLWRVAVTVPHAGHAFSAAGSPVVRVVALWLGAAALLAVAARAVVRRDRGDASTEP